MAGPDWTTMGPVGLFMLALLLGVWFLYLRFGPKAHFEDYHTANTATLSRIELGVDQTLAKVLQMNGRVGKLEEWRGAHEKQDDERYERNQVDHEAIRRSTDVTRISLHELRNEIAKDGMRRRLRGEDES